MQQLEMEGLYVKENEVHRQCLSVVFHRFIESGLNEFRHYWNTHCIRESHSDCIGGIPDDLYDMPLHYGKHACIQCLFALYL